MAYIYQITNDVNGKIYIGKTERTIQERWGEHCRDYLKHDYEKRPLYSAMKKYGVENFSFKVLEETNSPEEREMHYIDVYRSYVGFKDCNGYNATLGGDGKHYLDYDLVIATYQEVQNVSETARRMGIDISTVSKVLNSNHISIVPSSEVSQRVTGNIVNQYDLQGNFIQSFPSAKAAATSLGKITSTSRGASSHISDVCRGKRKTAYGYIWKFANK